MTDEQRRRIDDHRPAVGLQWDENNPPPRTPIERPEQWTILLTSGNHGLVGSYGHTFPHAEGDHERINVVDKAVVMKLRERVRDLEAAGNTNKAVLTDKQIGKLGDEILSLHRQLAAEKLRADQGWARADAKSKECIELRERLAAPGLNPSDVPQQTAAARDVLAERRRQMEQEGWTPAHDDQYQHGEMARAAACYASINSYPTPSMWPWAPEWWKPRDFRSNYVRAAALLLAQIEQIDRGAQQAQNSAKGSETA